MEKMPEKTYISRKNGCIYSAGFVKEPLPRVQLDALEGGLCLPTDGAGLARGQQGHARWGEDCAVGAFGGDRAALAEPFEGFGGQGF